MPVQRTQSTVPDPVCLHLISLFLLCCVERDWASPPRLIQHFPLVCRIWGSSTCFSFTVSLPPQVFKAFRSLSSGFSGVILGVTHEGTLLFVLTGVSPSRINSRVTLCRNGIFSPTPVCLLRGGPSSRVLLLISGTPCHVPLLQCQLASSFFVNLILCSFPLLTQPVK